MIKINLLPQEMAGSRASSGPSASTGSLVVALVLFVVFGSNVAIGGYLYYAYSEAARSSVEAKARSEKVQKQLKDTELTYNDNKLNLERMQRLIDVHNALDTPGDGLLWSRKLNMLPLLVPPGVFIVSVDLTQRVIEKETPESIKAKNTWQAGRRNTPPPPTIKEPTITQTLNIDAIAYVQDGTPNQRLEQITSFIANVRDKRVKLPFDEKEFRFIDGFSPNIGYSPVTMAKVEGRDVSKFRLTLTTQPLTIK